MKTVQDFLLKNGFKKWVFEGEYKKGKCLVYTYNDHYKVDYYEEELKEWVEWYSNDLVAFTLIGFLSYNDLIGRGYEI